MSALMALLQQSTGLPLPTTLNEAALIMFSVACIGVILRSKKRDEDALDALRAKRDAEREEQLLGMRSSTEAMNEMAVSVRGVTEAMGIVMQQGAARDAVIKTIHDTVLDLQQRVKA